MLAWREDSPSSREICDAAKGICPVRGIGFGSVRLSAVTNGHCRWLIQCASGAEIESGRSTQREVISNGKLLLALHPGGDLRGRANIGSARS